LGHPLRHGFYFTLLLRLGRQLFLFLGSKNRFEFDPFGTESRF
jgi:hypothetical protein